MAAQPTPVEVFGVRSDGELIPLRPRSASAQDGAPTQAQGHIDADRVWIVGSMVDAAADSGDEHSGLPTYQARKAPRPGGFGDRPTRGGGREDVVTPVHVLPGIASQALHTGNLFDDPLPGLTVDVNSLEVGSHGSSWDATVRCKRFGVRGQRTRRATLRAYPSPSANLTVLELVPRRSRLVHTRAFIRAGVPAIATLSIRIARASRTRRSTSPVGT